MKSLTVANALSTPSTANALEWIPKKYQQTSIKWMLAKVACGLALAPGLGKTAIVLYVLKILIKKGYVRKTLIFAKRRIIRKTWPDENRKWGFDLDMAVVHGTTSRKAKLLAEDHDVYLMTYESIDWLYRQPRALHAQFDMLVMDESSKIKNWTAKRSKILRAHINEFQRRYCLTGSLQPNTEMDIFNPTYMLDGGQRLGRFITAFRNRWFYPSGFDGHDWKLQREHYRDGTHDDGAKAADEIAAFISDIWLRFGDEELDLPTLSKVVRSVELGDNARRVYLELEDEYIAEIESGLLVTPGAGVARGKLRQITGGAVYTRPAERNQKRGQRPFETLDTEKLDELEDLIEDLNGLPVLIAYEFDHERQRIQARLPKVKLPNGEKILAPAIGGGTSDADADLFMDLWNQGKLPYLLGQPDSMAHGLNMQEVHAAVCFFNAGDNYENHDQLIRRVWRQGQKHRVIVYYLVAGDTVDEDIVASNDAKGNRQNALYAALLRRNKKRIKKEPNEMAKKAPKQSAAAKAVAKGLAKNRAATASKKAPAAKKRPKEKIEKAKAAGRKTRLRISNTTRIKRGKAPTEGTVFEAIYKSVHHSGSTALGGLVIPTQKKLDGKKITVDWVRQTVLRGIKQGFFTVA